ncbi:MAG: peptidoglycan DD-metalloendopeptidase family protein [Dermatophilaceae bacterium]
MRLLSTAVSAAFVAAVALTATAAVPAARPRTPVSPAKISLATISLAQPSTAQAGRIPITVADPVMASTIQVAARGVFAWPLSPRPPVNRRFEPPASRWSSGHRGVDLLAAVGQPVLSSGDGVVAFSGVIAGRGVITVRHSGGLRTTYEPVDERLASGTLLQRSARIGIISPTPGHCEPRHCLHWGAISGDTYRDPLSLLGFGRPILLPLG